MVVDVSLVKLVGRYLATRLQTELRMSGDLTKRVRFERYGDAPDTRASGSRAAI